MSHAKFDEDKINNYKYLFQSKTANMPFFRETLFHSGCIYMPVHSPETNVFRTIIEWTIFLKLWLILNCSQQLIIHSHN